jgi:hypothetical protein
MHNVLTRILNNTTLEFKQYDDIVTYSDSIINDRTTERSKAPISNIYSFVMTRRFNSF